MSLANLRPTSGGQGFSSSPERTLRNCSHTPVDSGYSTGEIDWHKFISTLYDIGYEGAVAIEHEDPVYEGEKRREGLRLGYKHLSLWMIKEKR